MNRLSYELSRSMPSFWRDNFEDQDFLDGLMRSISSEMSELYIRALASVTNSSVFNCLDSYSPEFRVLQIRSSMLVPTGSSWALNVPSDYRYVKTLVGSTRSGSDILESGVDFSYAEAGNSSLAYLYSAIRKDMPVLTFVDNPFSWGDSGRPIRGSLTQDKFITGPFFVEEPQYQNSVYDDIAEQKYMYVKNGSSVTKHIVSLVADDAVVNSAPELSKGLYLYSSTPAPYSGEIQVAASSDGFNTYGSSTELQVSSITIQDPHIYVLSKSPEVDRYYLYSTYGALFSDEISSSTETYRSSLIYRMMLRTKEFTEGTLESVIALMLNAPYVEGDDEIALSLVSYDGGLRLNTSRTSYLIPDTFPLSSYILSRVPLIDGEDNDDYVEPEDLVMDRFAPLVDASTIESNVTGDQSWWYGSDLVIPGNIMPKANESRRVIGVGTEFDNTVGTTQDEQASVGDYCIVIGEATRQRVAFRTAKDFLRQRMVIITKPSSYSSSWLSEDQKAEITAAAPSDILVIFKD